MGRKNWPQNKTKIEPSLASCITSYTCTIRTSTDKNFCSLTVGDACVRVWVCVWVWRIENGNHRRLHHVHQHHLYVDWSLFLSSTHSDFIMNTGATESADKVYLTDWRTSDTKRQLKQLIADDHDPLRSHLKSHCGSNKSDKIKRMNMNALFN